MAEAAIKLSTIPPYSIVQNQTSRMRVLGTGRAIPKQIITNEDISQRVNTSDEWIREHTGISTRHIVEKGQAASDLAAEAGLHACEAAGISPADIDCVICSTITPDMPSPSCAILTQRKLGAHVKQGPAFDISAACSGFLYGLTVAEGLLISRQYQNVLLCSVDVASTYTNPYHRGTAALFGDGAGAVLLSLGTKHSFNPQHYEPLLIRLFSDGTFTDLLTIPAGGSLRRTTLDTVEQNLHFIHMNGKAIFSHAVEKMTLACLELLEDNGLSTKDIDVVIPHQANLRIIEAVANRLHISMEKVFVNIDRYGNTISATIPIALDEAVRSGRVQRGDRILFCSIGAGLAWGAAYMKW